MSIFSLLDPRIRKVLPKLGITSPTPIQRVAIPKLLSSNSNAILIAPTGSGKTEAVFLPVLSSLMQMGSLDPIVVLYITPLRALNRDIFRRLIELATSMGFSIDIRHGDTPARLRRKQSDRPPQILITTPESLNVILWSPKLRVFLRNIKFVIIDEIHSLIGSKRGVQLAVALERLKMLSNSFRTILLSATLAEPDLVLKYFTGGTGGDVIRVEAEKKYAIKIEYVEPKAKREGTVLVVSPDIRDLVRKIVKVVRNTKGKVLIFTNTRDMAEVLASHLRRHIESIAVHHSSIDRDLRIETEVGLREGKLKAVVATSSLELGIDIGDIDLVIQVGSPRRVEVLMQRVGRSGHALDKISRGIIYSISIDDLVESIAISELARESIIERKSIPQIHYDVMVHQMIGIIRDYMFDYERRPTIREVYDIIKSAYPYRNLRFESFRHLAKYFARTSRAFSINPDNTMQLTRRSILLYFKNVSMIPTTIKYAVIDSATNKKIGELDEKYVMELDTNKRFLLASAAWEVLRIEYDTKRVFVRHLSGISEPPEWIGELMPVSALVARRVGYLRRIFWGNREVGIGNVDPLAIDKIRKVLGAYKSQDDLPDDKKIIVEYKTSIMEKGIIVVHSLIGNSANRFLGMVLYRLLLEETPLAVMNVNSDAYRIYLELYPSMVNKEAIRRAFYTVINRLKDMLDKDEFESYVKDTIRRSYSAISWYFLNVAKRLGIISETPQSKQSIYRLLDRYKSTPIMEEAINEYILAKGGLDDLIEFVKDLVRGKIRIIVREGLSPLANPEVYLISEKIDAIEREALEGYKKKLLRRRIKWVCLQCGYSEIRRVSQGALSSCPKCGASLLAVTKPRDLPELIIERMKSRGEVSTRDLKKLDFLMSMSQILKFKPNLAMLAVAAAVNLNMALALLQRYSDEKSLLLRLRELENNYAKIRF